MNGLSIGRLMVYVEPWVSRTPRVGGANGTHHASSLVWYRSGHQSLGWLYEVLDLGDVLSKYFVS